MTDKTKDLDQNELVDFCPCCYASMDDGSWGSMGHPAYCQNCGASGAGVKLPRWAIKSIREQASWIGKRYYPHSEDKEAHEERRALLALVKDFPGRTVERWKDPLDGKVMFSVCQRMPDGRTYSMVMNRATSAEEAYEMARLSSLPYVPEDKLGPSKS